MLNIVENNKSISLESVPVSLEDLFSEEALLDFEKLRKGELDYLVLKGFPVSADLRDTPTEIRDSNQPKSESIILTTIANALGKISDKGIENTIRFNTEGDETNTETWHSHFQFSMSAFYCLRGDPAAVTYFLSANDVMKNAGEIGPLLLKPFTFIENFEAFPLLAPKDGKYIFSKHIFDRSDLEKHIKDLDLPDVVKMLKKILVVLTDSEAQTAVRYLVNLLENAQDHISYQAGDIMIVREPATIRYSFGYKPQNAIDKARWLLAVSVM